MFQIFQWVTILLMGILAGAEVDLFVPSFPELAEVFNLTPFMLEWTLGINLVAHCISALFVGTLGDKYGRKPVILAGLGIFIVGSIFCVIATSYTQLLLGRFLQGMGVAGPAVLAYLIVADLYGVQAQQKLMGMLNGMVTLGMAFAPLVGSYISLWFKWQGNFVALLGLGIVCLLGTVCFIPHTGSKADLSLSLREYLPVLVSKKAWCYILTISFLIIPFWVFVGIAPILYMQDLGVSLEAFGWYQGAIAGIFSICSFTSGMVLQYFGAKKCLYGSAVVLLAFMCSALTLAGLGVSDPMVITACLLLLAMGAVFPINILYPLALEAVPNAKGRITAIILSSRLILTALCLQVVGFFYAGVFFHIGIVMCVCLVLAFWMGYQLVQEENVWGAEEAA